MEGNRDSRRKNYTGKSFAGELLFEGFLSVRRTESQDLPRQQFKGSKQGPKPAYAVTAGLPPYGLLVGRLNTCDEQIVPATIAPV